jgi:large subunit ribosomal protein L9
MKKKEKVILLKNGQIGEKGEVKELSRGFVINYLIPSNEVKIYNKRNSSLLMRLKEERRREIEKEKREKISLYEKLNNHEIFFELNKNAEGGVFGSVGFKEILNKLKDYGIERGQLTNFQSINKTGKHSIKIKIDHDLFANLFVTVI